MPNVIASYPFYPFQLAYMKDMLKNESKGSARNMMKTIKSIMKRPEVYNQEVGYYVGTDLIYDELKSKRSIEDEYSDLIASLESDPVLDDKQNPIIDKSELLTVLKAVVLLSQVKAEGVKDTVILPFVYSDKISNKEVLLNWLDILVRDNYVNNEGGLYTPITKKESDVWSRIKGITSITETAIREKAYEYIYDIYNASLKNGKHLVEGKINDTKKSIAFVLKKSDESREFPNAYTCIPFENDIEAKKAEALAASNDREKIYIIPEKKYDGDALGKAIKFYLQMDEALEREGDFGIDAKLRIQIETKRDTAIAGKIESIISECFKNAVISYNGQDNKDFAKEPSTRLTTECEKMLKKRYSMFFGKNLRDSVDKFITKEILTSSVKMTSPYLKDLDLIDATGNVNTANRYYSEFLKAFPDNGFDRDGSAVIDDFSKGKYGWELDTIKIMVALALRNSDIKIAHEGKTFVIPDDAAALTGSKGPLTARKRDVFDACKLTRINISDESIRDAIKLLKTIDNNIMVNQKLKDVAENIKILMNKLKGAKLDNYSSIVSQEMKDDVAYVDGIASDVLGRKDAEDTIVGFNSLISDTTAIDRFRKVFFIVDNASNVAVSYKLVSLMEVCNCKDKEQAIEAGKKYIEGDNKQFDVLKKLYVLSFNQAFEHYKNTYAGYVSEIKKMSEWSNINDDQKKKVLDELEFIEISGVVISSDLINANGLGTLEKLKEKQSRLQSSYASAVTKLHVFNDENNAPKHFIVIWCPGGETRPYSSPKTMEKDNKERIHYIRKSSNSVEPTDDDEKDLFNLANRVPFDDRVNHQAEMSDLNITLIQNYLKEVKSSLYEKSKTGDFIEVCQDMNIVSTLPEYIKPKNVGLMFFSMAPDKFFPYTQIDVVQFPSGLGGNDIIEKTFKGPIQQQLRDALQYIQNMIITEKVIKHPDRAEADRFFNFPYAAIEEALSNAVYHRAYDEREPIEVRVENDRIEIVSFPGPDRSVTMEGLKSYRVSNRRYRNRRIGDFLKELHLTEGRNTGFKKILDALEANGSPKPEFETNEDRSYFITRLFVHEGFGDNSDEEPKRSQKGAKKEPKKGAERKRAILAILAENPTITQTQLMEEMNLTRKQVQNDMKELQKEGLLVREGTNRRGRWLVKY